MSYELVKKIRIEGNEVFVTSASNNVFPRDYYESKSSYLSDILQTEGETALIVDLLRAYEEGNFQEGTPNKYSKAIERLRYNPEYAAFNWRNKNYELGENCPIEQARKSPAFKAILLQAYNTKPEKDKFIISKDYFGKIVYLWRVTWHQDKANAKTFNFLQEAEGLKTNFTNGNAWTVERV